MKMKEKKLNDSDIRSPLKDLFKRRDDQRR